LDFILNK